MRAFTRAPNPRGFHVHRDLALLVLVVIGSAAPFLSQPFHMDDNFYMDMARNVRAHPLFPYETSYDFGGGHVPDMASHSHPPLQAYFLALVQHVAGEGPGREWLYHTAALPFPLLAVIAFYFLAARFVERPLWPALALAVCPLFMLMAHTLMTDMPMLAFWLAATACFLWAADLKHKGLYCASALFQFAAMFTSYQAVSLLPLLGYYQIRRRGGAFGWLVLLLPPVVMLSWLGMTSAHFGRMILGDTVGFVQSFHAGTFSALASKAIALLEYQGWLILFPVFVLYIFCRGLRGRLPALLLLAAIYLAQLTVSGYRLADKAIFVIGLVAGASVFLRLAGFAREAWMRGREEAAGIGRGDARFLSLWYFGVIAYCLIMFTGGSARYILPLGAPVLILFFRGLEIREVSEYREERRPFFNSAMVASGSLILTLAWGLFLAQADFEFARIYPRAAAAFSRLSSGLDVFVTGEWGLRYYLARDGARPLPADESKVPGGSLLVKPRLAMPYDAPTGLATMTLPFARLSFDLKTPFRVMDAAVPAGFYSSGWGMNPFSISGATLEVLDVRQVSFMVANLPWAQVETSSPVKPWPGLAMMAENVPALMVKSGTRVSYPLSLRRPMVLKLHLGVMCDPSRAQGASFDFAIQQRDREGKVVARLDRSLDPTSPWQPVELPLAPGAGGCFLDFRFSARASAEATGVFAAAVLIPK